MINYKQREQWRKASLKYYYAHRKICIARAKAFTQKNREKINKIANEYYHKNKKRKFNTIIINKTKRLFGKADKCLFCNTIKNVEWHHFTEPYEADKVIPLCRNCHREVHHAL